MGIESSCDDTGIAVLRASDGVVLGHSIATQVLLITAAASRSHLVVCSFVELKFSLATGGNSCAMGRRGAKSGDASTQRCHGWDSAGCTPASRPLSRPARRSSRHNWTRPEFVPQGQLPCKPPLQSLDPFQSAQPLHAHNHR